MNMRCRNVRQPGVNIEGWGGRNRPEFLVDKLGGLNPP